MNNTTRRALDIALATETRGMYAGLLTDEDKQRIAQLKSVQELLSLLSRNSAWHDASLVLQSGELSDSRFSDAISRCIFADFEKLYRFANDSSRRFLDFLALDVELQAIMSALRRLASPPHQAGEEGADTLPESIRDLPGHNVEQLRRARTYEDITAAVAGSIYAKPLAELKIDEKTGLPSLPDAVEGLEARFFEALADYMRKGYDGPAKDDLRKAVEFRADMLNISYIMRLRRFNTPGSRAGRLLLPLHGSLTMDVARRALDAGSDEEALAVLRSTRAGKLLPEELTTSPEAAVRAAQTAYFRKVLHGKLNLAVVYAFLTLKEYEGKMLRRVFVALRYGLSPAGFMD